MARMQRLWTNLFGGWFRLSRRFPAVLLDEMATTIAAGERHHLGEIRFAVESRYAQNFVSTEAERSSLLTDQHGVAAGMVLLMADGNKRLEPDDGIDTAAMAQYSHIEGR